MTGVSGQDGSYLAALLADRGYEVVGLVRGSGERLPDGVSALTGDLLAPATLRAAVHDARPDELYHLAAPTFVPDSWEDPTETVAAIATATATLLAAAREVDPAMRVWVSTSSEVFGDAGESPQTERSPMRPRTPYGAAKLAAHGLVGAMRERLGLFACSGLTYNHESPRRPEQFLTRKVTRGAAAIKLGLERELVLGDLDAVRDWSHAADVVRAAWLALQAPEPGRLRDRLGRRAHRARLRRRRLRARSTSSGRATCASTPPSCARPSRWRWWATRRAPASAWAGRPSTPSRTSWPRWWPPTWRPCAARLPRAPWTTPS